MPCPTCVFFMYWSYIAHSHLLHTPLLPLSCIGLYLTSSSKHVMFTLCFVAFYFVFGLSFIFSFILHPSCIIIIVHTFISCLLFSLTLCLFLTKRGRVYSREYRSVFVISIWLLCSSLGGEILVLMHICRGRDIPQGRCIYQGGEDIVLIRKLCSVCFLVGFMVFCVMLCCSHCIMFVFWTCIYPYAIVLLWMHVRMIIVVIFIWLFWCMIKLLTCFTSYLLDHNLIVTLYLSFYYLLYLEGLMCFVQVFQVTSIFIPSASQLLIILKGRNSEHF